MKPSVTPRRGNSNMNAPGLGPALALVIIALGALVFLNSGFFDLKDVTISGLKRMTRAEVLALAGLERPVNIFKVAPRAICRKMGGDPRVRAAVVERRLPGNVNIRVDERAPLFGIPLPGQLVLVSDDGVVLPADPEIVNIPIVAGLKQTAYRTGEKAADPRLVAAGDFLRNASPELLARISEIDVERQDQIRLYLSGGVVVDLGGSDFARRKMEALAVLLADSIQRDKRLVQVNLHSPENPSVRWEE